MILSEVDQKLVIDFSTEVYTVSREIGLQDRQINKKLSPIAVHIQGYGGEVAFARIMGIDPMLRMRTSKSDAFLFDNMYKGNTIEIKTSPYTWGKLLAREWTVHIPDYYAAMFGTFPTYDFKGFFPGKLLITPERFKLISPRNPHVGSTYQANQSELSMEIPNANSI